MTTAFSQRDPRWAGAQLGTSELTIGEAGCLLCSVASLLADFGREIDPGTFNRWLGEHGGYAGGYRLRFVVLEAFGVRVSAWQDYYRTPANLARVARHLAAGRGGLALIDRGPGCDVQAHWVRIVEVRRRDCLIMDPWQPAGGELVSLGECYGGPGWDAGRAIFLYAALSAEPGRADRRMKPRVQPALCWRAAA